MLQKMSEQITSCGDSCPKNPENQAEVEKIMVAACIGQEPSECVPKSQIAQKIRNRLLEQGMKPCMVCAELEKYQEINLEIETDLPEFAEVLRAERLAFEQFLESVLGKIEAEKNVDFEQTLAELDNVIDLNDIQLMLAAESSEVRARIKNICNNSED